ncbi:MAG: ferrous iron transport protein B [Clostridium sp.]
MKRIALAGNPNCGKTSLFNILTKARQHVGNWPGVTVEKKEGILKVGNEEHVVIDLPGTYSLGAYSEDEIVARDYIIKENPDVVINVIDATNIERNLYLTTQIIEMGANVVIALNMMDEAEKKGIKIDIEKLSKELKVPVVSTVAIKKLGIEKLIDTALNTQNKAGVKVLDYGETLNKEIHTLTESLYYHEKELEYPANWTAVKLLENDNYIVEEIKKLNIKEVEEKLKDSLERIVEDTGFDSEIAIVDKRYTFISKIVQKTIVKKKQDKKSLSDKADKIITNKYLGIPIFAAIMLGMYQLTFIIGAGLQGWLGDSIANLGSIVADFMTNAGSPELLVSFINDGIFGGVGALLSFLPLIMVMYFLIGLLEDSGYMARAAYVMDKLMRALGLHGKTFVSMIIGVGCNVPGIMATRTLENKKDRMIAILINPFVSCGARLPIYAVFIEAFFSKNQGLVLFSLYITGIIVALIAGKIFSKTLFKGEPSYFVMELPSYKIPSINNVVMLMWEKASAFFKKAGAVIFPMMIVLWVLGTFPLGTEQYGENSLIGIIGGAIAPLFAMAGFGTWQAGIALITGVIAKESVVATMGLIYAGVAEGAALTTAIQSVFTPLTAVSFMVMSLLYTPCLAALGAIKRETNSWKWTIFSAVYTFVIALVISTIVYQVGLILGFR